MKKLWMACALFSLALTTVKAQSKTEEKKLRLIAIDTTIMDRYYVLTFKSSSQRYQVFSFKRMQDKDGYWLPLKKGKKYTISIKAEGDYINEQGVNISLEGHGLSGGKRDGKYVNVLEPGEFFYFSDDINGLLIRCDKR